jgi:integrase
MAIYPDKKNGAYNGRWRVELQRTVDGRVERYRRRWDSRREAEEDEKAVQAAWCRGEEVSASKPAAGSPEVHTFATVIPLGKGQLWSGKSTEDTCWAHIESCAGILGKSTRLDAVDTHSIDKLIKDLRKLGKAPATINRYLSHLRTFLVWAKKRKYRTAPITGEDGIEFDWQTESVGRIRWITPEEEIKLKEYLPDNVWKLVKVAIETGCRRDELLTVEPGQINGHRLHLWETKTDTPRTVPMSQETTSMLTELITSGTMPTRRNLRSWWERAKAKMNLEQDGDFVFHACRHTRATRMVDAGVNVFVIKEWMGHKRIETTLRYAHVKPQNLEDALVRVGEYEARGVQNPQKSATFAVPHTSPTGGEIGGYSMAA